MTEPRSAARRPSSVGKPGKASPEPPAPRRDPSAGEVQESTVKKKALGLAVFLIIALSVLNAFFGDRGVLSLMAARQEYIALAGEVAVLEAANHQLAREIHALRTDPLTIERRAREVLGMARPGEIALQVLTPEPRWTAPPPATR